jgi:hypothetical protein
MPQPWDDTGRLDVQNWVGLDSGVRGHERYRLIASIDQER